MAEKDSETKFCYAIINNIPLEYHSKDLRNYFSLFIETKGFVCFHYRHRPESVASVEGTVVSGSAQTSGKRSCCCVVKVSDNRFAELLKMYNKKHWVDSGGEIIRQVCYIFRIKLPTQKGRQSESPKSFYT